MPPHSSAIFRLCIWFERARVWLRLLMPRRSDFSTRYRNGFLEYRDGKTGRWRRVTTSKF